MVGNAGPFGDFDLSDMDLSLTSLCKGSNNVRESKLAVAVASVALAVVVALELVEVAVVLVATVADEV